MTDEQQPEAQQTEIKFRPGPKQRLFVNRVMETLETSLSETMRLMVNHCRTCPSFLSTTFGSETIPDETEPQT